MGSHLWHWCGWPKNRYERGHIAFVSLYKQSANRCSWCCVLNVLWVLNLNGAKAGRHCTVWKKSKLRNLWILSCKDRFTQMQKYVYGFIIYQLSVSYFAAGVSATWYESLFYLRSWLAFSVVWSWSWYTISLLGWEGSFVLLVPLGVCRVHDSILLPHPLLYSAEIEHVVSCANCKHWALNI